MDLVPIDLELCSNVEKKAYQSTYYQLAERKFVFNVTPFVV